MFPKAFQDLLFQDQRLHSPAAAHTCHNCLGNQPEHMADVYKRQPPIRLTHFISFPPSSLGTYSRNPLTWAASDRLAPLASTTRTVSYTHLDVYKRQEKGMIQRDG